MAEQGRMMRCRFWVGAMIFSSLPVSAQTELPPAPQYYLDAVISMSLADQYAANCPQVAVNHTAIGYIYQGVQAQLATDGFPASNPVKHMQLPPQSETDAIIIEMLERSQSTDNPEASFCTEALGEIDKQSLIGSMMEKVIQ